MNALESKSAHPQPCYLLDGVGAKPRESTGKVCIATSHTVPASKQGKERLLSSTSNLWIHRRKKKRKKVLKIPRISTEIVP